MSSINSINLKTEIFINTLISKYTGQNNDDVPDSDIVDDLLQCVAYIPTEQIYVVKNFDAINKRYVLKYVTKATLKDILSAIKIRKEGKKQITGWNIFDAHNKQFQKSGIEFYCERTEILSVFQGYKYDIKSFHNDSIIAPFLNHIREVITNNNEMMYEYIINWMSYIVQKPGKKTDTAIVLKGIQGAGKNVFTDVLCELLSGYSKRNVTQIAELTGTFNSIVENQMLIVLNELQNSGENRLSNFDALKSIVTDNTVRVNEKNQPRRTAQNVANFIFVTKMKFATF
jgi:predicted house-cleaning NTP pyrophosphatase (Maf/HAM1 superfamily)